VRQVAEQVHHLRGKVVEACFLWNRGKITATHIGAPTCSLINESIEHWSPEDAPEWGALPLVSDIGHPEYFPDYQGGYVSLLK
jgi:hypothetical protein